MSISHDVASKSTVYDLVIEAQRLLDNDQINDAIDVAKQATEADIRNASAWSILGLAYDRFGDREEAIIALKRAIMAQPDQAIYYGRLGSVYESEENWTDAFQCYNKAYGIDSSSSMYLASSGIALINMGQVGEGIRVLEQCVELEPKNSSFQKALATAYLESAYLGWTKVDEGQPVATDNNQVTLAQSALKRALSLSFEDPELTADLKKLEQDIDSMTRKMFVGNKGLPLLIGAFALLASFNGGGTIAIFYLLIVVLYVGGSFIPQYAINRQLISGNKFDEFGWISRYFFEDDIDYKNLFTEINFKNIFTVYKLCIGCSLTLVAFPVFAIYNIYRYHGSQIHQWLASPQNKDHLSILFHELQSQTTHSVEAASDIVANLETKAKDIEYELTHQGKLARLPPLRVKQFLTKIPKFKLRSFVAIVILLLLFIFAFFTFRNLNSPGISINNWIDWTKFSSMFSHRINENTSVILRPQSKLGGESDQINENYEKIFRKRSAIIHDRTMPPSHEQTVSKEYEPAPHVQMSPVPSTPIHKLGDSYTLQSINLENGTVINVTQRKIVFANSEKVVVESKNIASKSSAVRQLEYTPEWNLISIRNADASRLTYKPPLKYYDFPLISGKTWKQTSVETNTNTGAIKEHTLLAVVGDWEDITVPAGTFRGVKVTVQTELVDRNTGQKITGQDTSWYVPEVRKSVRSLTSSKNPEGVESRQDLQLVRYDLIDSVVPILQRSAGISTDSNENILVASPVLPKAIASFIGSRSLKMPSSISKYCGFDFKTDSNPFFISGDFDGDGRLDYAVNVGEKSQVGKIFVFLGNGRIHELGGWEYIYTDKRRGTIQTYEGNINLKYDSIGGVKCESSSVVYVYNKTKNGFDQYLTSD